MRHGVDPAVPVVTFQPISRPERTTILDPSGNHPFSATATRAPLAGVRLVLAIALVAVCPTLACRADQAPAGSTAGPPPTAAAVAARVARRARRHCARHHEMGARDGGQWLGERRARVLYQAGRERPSRKRLPVV